MWSVLFLFATPHHAVTTDKYLMPPMSPGGLFMIEKMREITAVTYHQRNTPALFNKQFANRVLIELFKEGWW